MANQKLIEETKNSALFRELCTLMDNGAKPASLILTALVKGIEIGRGQGPSFPLPRIEDSDEKFVLDSALSDPVYFEKGLSELFEYMPMMRDHISLGCFVHDISVISIVAKQLVMFFQLQRRAAERREIEDLEFLVRN